MYVYYTTTRCPDICEPHVDKFFLLENGTAIVATIKFDENITLLKRLMI